MACASRIAVLAAQDIRLRIGTVVPRGSLWHDTLQYIAQDWQRIVGPGLKVVIHPDSQLGDEIGHGAEGEGRHHRGGRAVVGGALAHRRQRVVPAGADDARVVRGARLRARAHRAETWSAASSRAGSRCSTGPMAVGSMCSPSSRCAHARRVCAASGCSHRRAIRRPSVSTRSSAFNVVPYLGDRPRPDAAGRASSTRLHCRRSSHRCRSSSSWRPNMTDVRWVPLVGGTVITVNAWERLPAVKRDALLDAARKPGDRSESRHPADG